MKRTYTLKEAATLLNISQQTLRRWSNSAKIQCVKTAGGHRRYSSEAIANFLGCPVEELQEHIKAQRTQEPDTLKEKKREVVGLRLDIEKEKAKKALVEVKGDDDVRKAENELKILKIAQETEQLLVDRKKAATMQKEKEKREAWVRMWLAYGERYLDPWAEATTAERLALQVETIPLEVKIDVRKEIVEALKDIELKEDPDRIRLSIQNIVDRIWTDYYKPIEKKNLIRSAIAGLTFPLWLDMSSNRAVKEKIISGVGKILGERVTGLEDYEEINKRSEEIKNQMIRAIEESK